MNVLVLTDNCVLSSGCEAMFQSRAIHGQPVEVDFPGFPLWSEEHVETNLASCNQGRSQKFWLGGGQVMMLIY